MNIDWYGWVLTLLIYGGVVIVFSFFTFPHAFGICVLAYIIFTTINLVNFINIEGENNKWYDYIWARRRVWLTLIAAGASFAVWAYFPQYAPRIFLFVLGVIAIIQLVWSIRRKGSDTQWYIYFWAIMGVIILYDLFSHNSGLEEFTCLVFFQDDKICNDSRR